MNPSCSSVSLAKVKLNVISSDNVVFNMCMETMKKSKNLQNMVQSLEITDPNDVRLEDPIHLPIPSSALKMIIEWNEKNKDNDGYYKDKHDARIQLTRADKEFCKQIDGDLAYSVLMGAVFLEIDQLVDVITQYIVDCAAPLKPDELLNFFHLPDDLTPEEKENLEKNYKWLYE